MNMDARRTAIVLIEYQNDFTTEGGAMHGAVAASMARQNMLSNSAELIRRARAAGAQILWTPIRFAEGYREITREPYGVLKGIVDAKAFRAGTWGAEITEALPRSESDIMIEGKRGLDAFASTNLDFILRSLGIETVAVCGFLTNCCVESTVRSAYERGFTVHALSDCCAATSHEAHDGAVAYDLPLFAHVEPHRAFLDRL